MFLADLFRALMARAPETPCLLEDGQMLTYGEFAGQIGYWSRQLRDRGIKSGDRVGVYLPNSIDGVIAIYAVVACGATFVPLAFDDPPHRLRLTVDDASLKLVLVGAKNPFPLEKYPCLTLDRNSGREEPLAVGALADENPLYMIYTSGSTGVPKGVLMSGRCLGHFTRWICAHLEIENTDVFLGHARLTFDISLFHLFAPIFRGACLRLVSQPTELAYPGTALCLDVTIAMFVPRVTGLMQQAGQLAPGQYPKLRHVVFCGERLNAYQANAWLTTQPELAVHNMYGPTETTVVCTFKSLTPGQPVKDPIAIGAAIPGNSAEFLTANGAVIKGETEGELIMVGEQISPWDYWGRATDRYFNHPELDRCFRTGDIVRRDTNGMLFWEGRVDEQIKVRGFRIELTDVEATLSDPQVEDLACIYEPRSERIFVGFCVPDAREAMNVEARLRARANERLPAYMRPSSYYRLSELPRTPNGKTDRRTLLSWIQSHLDRESVRPQE